MAPSSPEASSPPDDDVDDEVRRRPLVPADLIDTAIRWWRFVGPGRLLGIAGAGLVLAGIGWWMLRSPEVPTEARLPLAQRAHAASAASDVPGSDPIEHPPPVTAAAASPTNAPIVVVHVAGAVRDPGVYELPAGQRVADAIVAAGGALVDAAPDALNLAAPIADGDRIDVPIAGEIDPAEAASGGHSHAGTDDAGAEPAGPIDINTAGAADLEALPGIGPATAAAIVEHREQNGPYASIDDLEAVRGIGPAKLDAIRDQVTV